MTIEERNNILANANVPEDRWESSYVSEDGIAFTPIFNEKDEMIKTGEEHYKIWLENKKPRPSTLELSHDKMITPESRLIALQNQLNMINIEIQNIKDKYAIF